MAPNAQIPSPEQILAALPKAQGWDTAGGLIFEAMRALKDQDEETKVLLLRQTETCCLRLLTSAGLRGVAPELFYLPPRSCDVASFEPDRAMWQDLHRSLLQGQQQQGFEWSEDYLNTLLVAEGMIGTPGTALVALLRALTTIEPVINGSEIDREKLGGRLFLTGWFDRDDTDIRTGLAKAAKRITRFDMPTALVVIQAILKVFNFKEAPVWLSLALAEHVLFPLFDRTPQSKRDADIILRGEWIVYGEYLSKIDTRVHFKNTYDRMTPALEAAGKFLSLPDVEQAHKPNREPVRVAFLLHSHAHLAHARNYVTFLNGLSELDDPPILPITIINGKESDRADEPLPRAIRALGSDILWADLSLGNVSDFLAHVRHYVEQSKAAALIFVSTPTFLIAAAHARIAPRLVWWAMKYHAIETDGIDGYLTFGPYGESRLIDGRPWRSTFAALTDLYDDTCASEAAEIRAKFLDNGHDCLLACVGREEKINHRPYLETVQRILSANPKAHYLFTGRSVPPEVKAAFDDLNIADRCSFVGWIDTRVYAQVIDLYVDSYPFASGYTAWEAMAAGKPVTVLKTPEALETSTATLLLPILDRESGTKEDQDRIIELFSEGTDDLTYSPFMDTVEAYETHIKRLMDVQEFREACGNAGRRFVQEFLMDRTRMTRNICSHILDIIDSV